MYLSLDWPLYIFYFTRHMRDSHSIARSDCYLGLLWTLEAWGPTFILFLGIYPHESILDFQAHTSDSRRTYQITPLVLESPLRLAERLTTACNRLCYTHVALYWSIAGSSATFLCRRAQEVPQQTSPPPTYRGYRRLLTFITVYKLFSYSQVFPEERSSP
jgi:hypothetical protein